MQRKCLSEEKFMEAKFGDGGVRNCANSHFSNQNRQDAISRVPAVQESVTNLSLLFGFCAAYMLSYRGLQMEWWAAVTLVAITSQPALLM